MAAIFPLTRPRRTAWLFIVLGLAGLGIGGIAAFPSVREFIDEAIDWAKRVMEGQGATGAVVFLLFSALSAMLAFASSAVLVPSATLAWGQTLTFLLLWGGWVIGAAVAFGIGRLAYPLLLHMGYEEKMRKYQQYVSQRMRFWMVLLFCVAIPSEIPGYLFGSLHYPLVKFLTAIALAEAGYALGVVVAGESLLTDNPLPFFVVLGLLVAAAILAGYLLRGINRHRSRQLTS